MWAVRSERDLKDLSHPGSWQWYLPSDERLGRLLWKLTLILYGLPLDDLVPDVAVDAPSSSSSLLCCEEEMLESRSLDEARRFGLEIVLAAAAAA